ncbi:hypothetical protein [Maribacter sp. 2-571]|uniref:hypothetical protein n=1 Tax=Maribacter sp. 2-571 TaxID=3417569 RepID=UPI003D32C29E
MRNEFLRKGIVLGCFIVTGFAFGQQNMLDLTSWVAGTGNTFDDVFKREGAESENVREPGLDPFGNTAMVWRGTPESAGGRHGGWYTANIAIDHTKSYRLTVWVKKTGSQSGNAHFSFNVFGNGNTQQSLKLDGTVKNNPFFLRSDLPTLDTWYLLVGYVHGSGYTGTQKTGGVYNVQGDKLVELEDFKFTTEALSLRHRIHLYSGSIGESQFHYGPTIFELNDQEPSIAELLNPDTGSVGPAVVGGNTGPWSSNTNGVHFDSGNVGIGTADPGADWKLAVNGKIRAKEIKVETGWADYVFEKDYPLPTLDEVGEHIAKKGHLINIPSAAEVETNGVELGEMNKLLLEKIEELTLYILNQEERLKRLENIEKKHLNNK